MSSSKIRGYYVRSQSGDDVVKSDFIRKRGSTYNTVDYMNVCSEHKSDETFFLHSFSRGGSIIYTYSRYQRTKH